MIPENPTLLIYRAARRTAAEWSAAENLRKKLHARGADAKATHRAINDLAEALRTK